MTGPNPAQQLRGKPGNAQVKPAPPTVAWAQQCAKGVPTASGAVAVTSSLHALTLEHADQRTSSGSDRSGKSSCSVEAPCTPPQRQAPGRPSYGAVFVAPVDALPGQVPDAAAVRHWRPQGAAPAVLHQALERLAAQDQARTQAAGLHAPAPSAAPSGRTCRFLADGCTCLKGGPCVCGSSTTAQHPAGVGQAASPAPNVRLAFQSSLFAPTAPRLNDVSLVGRVTRG